ncbi:hypothetical protein BDN72DRAFT_966490 [Pluteus cervinus]|uniref:Uncharacterized protein n=1 Tax=Pluteus cervinus TaxID=181527 RepID=A0ACD2ZWR7_9AGAR|nr:hypothetical protein BDN72DRAFT_966490 [Pluteus cervinus]
MIERTKEKCHGMIIDIDGEHTAASQVVSQAHELSGTIPYMSERHLRSWVRKTPIELYLLDDMESAFWVMYIEYLQIAQDHEQMGSGWPTLQSLVSKDPDVVLEAKRSARATLGDTEEDYFFLGPFKDSFQCFWQCLKRQSDTAHEVVEHLWIAGRSSSGF